MYFSWFYFLTLAVLYHTYTQIYVFPELYATTDTAKIVYML
jgi:hypothetical protein